MIILIEKLFQNLKDQITIIMNFIKSQLNKLPKDLIIFIDGIGIIPVSYISSKEENLKLYITLIYFLFDGKNSTIELKEINCKTYLIQKKKTKKKILIYI